MPIEAVNGITVLTDAWHAIRHRPAMYIGEPLTKSAAAAFVVGAGCVPLFACGLTNVRLSVDAHEVAIEFDGDPSVLLEPYSAQDAAPTIEVILARLYACRDRHELKDVHGSVFCINGVSLAVVNALSHWVEVELHDGTRHWRHRREEGASTRPLEVMGPTTRTGGALRFQPLATAVRTSDVPSAGFEALRAAYAQEARSVVVELAQSA